jgi:hypothetical protein
MATTLSASRVVDGEPAVALLLMTGPDAAGFLPQTTLDHAVPGEVTGVLHLGDGVDRTLHVITAAPRRTPIAYISDFRVSVDGMAPANGALSVTSAGPARSNVVFSLRSDVDFPPEFAEVFRTISVGFFDGLERAASEQTHAA